MKLGMNQNSVRFSNLHSGNYTFLLRKRNGFEPNSFLTTSVQITIPKKFNETIWFILLCILAAILFTVLVAWLYAFNIRRRNSALEKNVQQRTLELTKANEELKQSVSVKDKLISIISHDIITPLNFITLVAQKGSAKETNLDKENIQLVLADIKKRLSKIKG